MDGWLFAGLFLASLPLLAMLGYVLGVGLGGVVRRGAGALLTIARRAAR